MSGFLRDDGCEIHCGHQDGLLHVRSLYGGEGYFLLLLLQSLAIIRADRERVCRTYSVIVNRSAGAHRGTGEEKEGKGSDEGQEKHR